MKRSSPDIYSDNRHIPYIFHPLLLTWTKEISAINPWYRKPMRATVWMKQCVPGAWLQGLPICAEEPWFSRGELYLARWALLRYFSSIFQNISKTSWLPSLLLVSVKGSNFSSRFFLQLLKIFLQYHAWRHSMADQIQQIQIAVFSSQKSKYLKRDRRIFTIVLFWRIWLPESPVRTVHMQRYRALQICQ